MKCTAACVGSSLKAKVTILACLSSPIKIFSIKVRINILSRNDTFLAIQTTFLVETIYDNFRPLTTYCRHVDKNPLRLFETHYVCSKPNTPVRDPIRLFETQYVCSRPIILSSHKGSALKRKGVRSRAGILDTNY